MAEDIAGGTVETPNSEELLDRLKKAEAKIVELKKTSKDNSKEEEIKETPKEETKSEEPKKYGDDDLDKRLEKMLEEKLATLQNNKQDKVEDVQEKQEDKYEANQEKTNSMSLGGEETTSSSSFKGISVRDFDNLTMSQKRDYMKTSKEKYGEVKFI